MNGNGTHPREYAAVVLSFTVSRQLQSKKEYFLTLTHYISTSARALSTGFTPRNVVRIVHSSTCDD